MNRTALLALCMASLLAGCSQPKKTLDSAIATRLPFPLVPVQTNNYLNQTCWAVAVTRAVSPDLEKQCPDSLDPRVLDGQTLNGRWEKKGKSMFRDSNDALAAVAVAPPPVMSRFCFYKWTQPEEKPAPPPPKQLLDSFGPGRFSVDCPVAFAQATPTGLTNANLGQAGRLAPGVKPGPIPVVVAVVDTGSDQGPMTPNPADHGGAMKGLVEELACNGANNCLIEIKRTLALPIHADGTVVDLKADRHSGNYGTRGHLAIGIVEAVNRWRVLATAGAVPRLVINLSVGWPATDCKCGTSEGNPWCGQTTVPAFRRFMDPTHAAYGEMAYDSQTAVEAVHAALLYAACNGALVVAAAGNNRVDSCNDDPMVPASWSRFRSPTEAECQDLGFLPTGEQPSWLEASLRDPAPLVLSVAAVDYDDRPIVATRPNSITRLVAPGYYAVGPPSTVPLTGTSVSSALVAGAAALMWSADANGSPKQVVDRLYEQANPTKTNLTQEAEEFGQRLPPSAQVRVLSACKAFAAVTRRPPKGLCRVSALTTTTAVTATATAAKAGQANNFFKKYYCEVCGDPVVAWLPRNPDPNHEYDYPVDCNDPPFQFKFDDNTRLDGLAGPQPNTWICLDCPLVVDSTTTTATLDLHPDYHASAELDLKDGLVTVWEGGSKTTYALEDDFVTDLRVPNRLSLGLSHHPNATKANVSFTVVEPSSTYSRSSQLRLMN